LLGRLKAPTQHSTHIFAVAGIASQFLNRNRKNVSYRQTLSDKPKIDMRDNISSIYELRELKLCAFGAVSVYCNVLNKSFFSFFAIFILFLQIIEILKFRFNLSWQIKINIVLLTYCNKLWFKRIFYGNCRINNLNIFISCYIYF
jgi:hypothetical protein